MLAWETHQQVAEIQRGGRVVGDDTQADFRCARGADSGVLHEQPGRTVELIRDLQGISVAAEAQVAGGARYGRDRGQQRPTAVVLASYSSMSKVWKPA